MRFKVVNPILSVIVPITNMAGRLHHLSSWISESSKKPIQIIIIHDITDQNTGIELRELLSKYELSNIVLIEGKYGSPGYARNAGLEIATGEWCVFWDSDDKPMVNTILLALTDTNLEDEIIIGKFNVKNCFTGYVRQDYTSVSSYKSIAMNPGIWRMIFRLKIIHSSRFTNLRSGEDQVFLSQLNFVEKKHKYVNKVFYEYSVGQDSQLTNSPQSLQDLPCASEIILKNALQNNGNSLVFDLILIIRQQITLLRRGNIGLKLQIIYFFIKFIKTCKLSMLLPTIQSLFFVMLNLNRTRLK